MVKGQGHWGRNVKNRFSVYLRENWIGLRQPKTKWSSVYSTISNIFEIFICFWDFFCECRWKFSAIMRRCFFFGGGVFLKFSLNLRCKSHVDSVCAIWRKFTRDTTIFSRTRYFSIFVQLTFRYHQIAYIVRRCLWRYRSIRWSGSSPSCCAA